MADVRKCYNAECEFNVEGIYCDACEIIISDCGMCDSFYPREKENNNEKNIQKTFPFQGDACIQQDVSQAPEGAREARQGNQRVGLLLAI